jgi:hypothetical protein
MNRKCWTTVLCLGFVSLLGGNGLFAAGPERSSPDQLGAKMKKEGWTEVASGVFERRLGATKVERLGYGREGFAWTIGELTRKIERLQKEQESYPSAELAKTLEDLRAHLAKTKAGLAQLESEPEDGLSSVTAASCSSLSHSETADAFATTAGVAAVAKASFNNGCGYIGDTYAYAYARATQGTTTTILINSDPRSGTSVTSQATAFVNGTTVPGIPCYSEASADVQISALALSYSISDVNSDCPGPLPPVQAGACNLDVRPAATLLLPYFEVDLDDPQGISTLISINNARPEATLAHVVFWTDLSVPVLDYNIYLTGYDVQTVNLRDILVSGLLPRTASAGQDPADTISPQGDFSQDINFASCNGQLPPPVLPGVFITHLQNALTGQFSSILGGCAGRDLDDRIARGYVTVDVVNNCTLRFPGDPGYFVAGGLGDATNQNVLWGDYSYVNPGQNFAEGDTLVHIEADATNPETAVSGEYTFYGRYVGWTAADNREPLPTNFAARFVNGGAFSGGTDFLVWRDSKVSQGAFKCGTLPTWFPLGQEQVVVFDEQENPEQAEEPISPFPAEAGRTEVGGAELPVSPSFGWVYLNLNTTVTAAGAKPPEDPAAAQAWVSVIQSSEGRFAIGHDAVRFDNACQALHEDIE